MSKVTHIKDDPNTEERIDEVVKGPVFRNMLETADSLARINKLDFKDFETIRRFFDASAFQVIEAIDHGRLYCEDQCDEGFRSDYMALYMLLIAALQVICDGHFVETFAEEARP
jgi:hypothetical protein